MPNNINTQMNWAKPKTELSLTIEYSPNLALTKHRHLYPPLFQCQLSVAKTIVAIDVL